MSNASAFDIATLMTPTAFPHAVDTISLHETHVSWVVLTGPFAYKIKKPLQLAFLDASTLKRRRFLCEEELRLNRRLAPELYVDVVAITRADAGVRVGGAGPSIEYAVRMHQFGRDEELASLLDRNAVTGAEIESLARLLAAFHAQAPRADASSAEHIAETLLTNLTELESSAQSFGDRPALDALSAWMRGRVADHRATLEERAQLGWVRECHGDLHAGNVARYGGHLLPFDCLEFDPDLRWIDVIDDVAFLVMDVASRGREDLAFTLLSHYLESSGDYRGVEVLALYAVHRALVRAKVDAVSAQTAAERRGEIERRFEQRLQAGVSWTQPRPSLLVLMHGVSGSGKSWLSERLVPALPAIRIRSDVERKRLAGLHANESATDRVASGMYSQEFTTRTYARLLAHAEACLRAGLTVIVDATFLEATRRRPFLTLAARHGAPVAIVACATQAHVAADRIRARAASGDRTSDADLAVLETQLKSMQPFDRDEAGLVVIAETSEASTVEDTSRTLRMRAERR